MRAPATFLHSPRGAWGRCWLSFSLSPSSGHWPSPEEDSRGAHGLMGGGTHTISLPHLQRTVPSAPLWNTSLSLLHPFKLSLSAPFTSLPPHGSEHLCREKTARVGFTPWVVESSVLLPSMASSFREGGSVIRGTYFGDRKTWDPVPGLPADFPSALPWDLGKNDLTSCGSPSLCPHNGG